MKEGPLLMSRKEQLRLIIMTQIASNEILQVEAAALLDLSVRQVKRIFKRYRLEGAAGLLHRSRGRPDSGRSKPESFRKIVLDLYREKYEGIGPTLSAEKLAEEGLVIDHETLRRWLLQEGLWKRRRKRGKHRHQRMPKDHFGELVQMDGSHHGWYGPERPHCCLMSMVDDATGYTMTLMAEQETTEAAMLLLWHWIKRHGIPKALYTDRKNVYVTERAPTLEEQLAGKEPMTAFGKACEKLGITIITAKSPQAKGRVERKHGVYQDRLYHELRLRGITTLEETNRLLHEGFDEQINEKFARSPRSQCDFHRPVPSGIDLQDVFCYEQTRTLANDWTICFNNTTLQILKLNKTLPRPKAKITVRHWLDGTLHLYYHENPLKFEILPGLPAKKIYEQVQHKKRPKPEKPAHAHPWRGKALVMNDKRASKS